MRGKLFLQQGVKNFIGCHSRSPSLSRCRDIFQVLKANLGCLQLFGQPLDAGFEPLPSGLACVYHRLLHLHRVKCSLHTLQKLLAAIDILIHFP